MGDQLEIEATECALNTQNAGLPAQSFDRSHHDVPAILAAGWCEVAVKALGAPPALLVPQCLWVLMPWAGVGARLG